MNKPTKAQKREAKKREKERRCYAQPGRKFTRDEMNDRDAVFCALLGF